MTIRAAEPNDARVISAHDRHIDERELSTLIGLGRVYLAEEDGRFIGWLRYSLFWDNTPFMNMIYLLEEFRGQGYGKRLVGHWEAEMKKAGRKVVMTSTASDEYAQHFYYRMGYKAVGGFTPFNEPYEIILQKNL